MRFTGRRVGRNKDVHHLTIFRRISVPMTVRPDKIPVNQANLNCRHKPHICSMRATRKAFTL